MLSSWNNVTEKDMFFYFYFIFDTLTKFMILSRTYNSKSGILISIYYT